MTKRLPVWMGLCTIILTADALPKLEARASPLVVRAPLGHRGVTDH